MSQPRRFTLTKPIRFTPLQWQKLVALGGATWLRATLDGTELPAAAPAAAKKRDRITIDAAYARGRGGISSELQKAWFDGQTLRGECFFDAAGERDGEALA